MIYFNIKTKYGVETVDELDPADFDKINDFKRAKVRLRAEYHLAGMEVYISRRCTNEWRKK